MDQFNDPANPFQTPPPPPAGESAVGSIGNSALGNSAMDKEARTWAMLCHLLALTGIPTGVGFVVGPLIAWVMKKDQYTFVDEHGKESLNFQISVLIYTFALTAVLGTCFVFIFFPLLILFFIIPVVDVILVIIAALKASNGEMYRYPLTIRFLK